MIIRLKRACQTKCQCHWHWQWGTRRLQWCSHACARHWHAVWPASESPQAGGDGPVTSAAACSGICSSSGSYTASPPRHWQHWQRQRRQPDPADCSASGTAVRASVTRSGLRALEETSAAAGSGICSSSDSCAVLSPRLQRRRRQPDPADCSDTARPCR